MKAIILNTNYIIRAIICFILLLLSIQFYAEDNCNSDLTDDKYEWIDNSSLKSKIKKIDKNREEKASKAYFSGSTNFVFFYYFDTWQGIKNDKTGDFGYKTRDFSDDDYHNKDNDGRIIKDPWGSIETGFFGDISISTPLFKSDKPLISDNKITFEFNWEFNWMQAGAGLKFTFSPLPIFYTSIGCKIGTGWEFLWKNDFSPILVGLGLSTEKGHISMPLAGPVINFDITTGIQMDFSALPGINKKAKRWLHIIATASTTLEYQGLINFNQNQPYIYIERRNQLSGWYFSFQSNLGYLIPIIEDETNMQSFRRIAHRNFSIMPLLQTTVGFNITHYNDSKMAEMGWGSDFVDIALKPLLLFKFPFNFNLIVYSGFVNGKRYYMDTIGNSYYQDREYEDWYFKADCIGIIFGYEF